MANPPKAPPKTIPRKEALKQLNTPTARINITTNTLADKADPNITGGYTHAPVSGAIPDRKGGFYKWLPPGYSIAGAKGAEKITKFNEPLEIGLLVTIQTSYGPKTKATDESAYGRGTTDADMKAGNVTLGFHESCHQHDYKEYFKTKAPPQPNVRIGMSLQQYELAIKAFSTTLDAYIKDAEKFSEQRTDEVGIKLSQYKIKHPSAGH